MQAELVRYLSSPITGRGGGDAARERVVASMKYDVLLVYLVRAPSRAVSWPP